MKKEQSLEKYIFEATKNIENDRAVASKLLLELVDEMSSTTDKYKHKDFGEIASKYLETLQRSNEQLVKIASIVQKNQVDKENLSINEKDQIFDMIKEQK